MAAVMLLFFAPAAFAASGNVVLCLEIDGQASLERATGKECDSIAVAISEAKSIATAQHCDECTDFALSNSDYRKKAASAQNTSKTVQKLFAAIPSLNVWPRLSVASLLAPTPPPLRISMTLAQLRTVIIRI